MKCATCSGQTVTKLHVGVMGQCHVSCDATTADLRNERKCTVWAESTVSAEQCAEIQECEIRKTC